jgi:hypothetical protein
MITIDVHAQNSSILTQEVEGNDGNDGSGNTCRADVVDVQPGWPARSTLEIGGMETGYDATATTDLGRTEPFVGTPSSRIEVAEPPSLILSPATLAAQRLIAQIHHLADQYWEEPDHEALNVVLAFIASYFLHERNPLWLHIVGESSSGKTELGMAPVALDYAEFHHLDDLTANTLLSGLTKGKDSGKRNSFLHRVGIFGLVYQEDFTTFLEKDERMVGAVAGQLRKVYDGQLTKETGVETRDGNGGWQGRISWITAMTPGAERKWVRHNPMGERFSIVRWRAARNHEAVSKKVLLQSAVEAKLTYLNADKQMNEQIAGPRKWIGWLTQMLIEGERYAGQLPGNGINEGLLRELVNQLQGLDLTPKPDSPSEQLVYDGGLYALAEVVTQLRTIPNRPDGRNIGQVLDRESSGRLQHQLIKVARGWAYLHRREVEAADMRLVQRVAEDSIPISKKPIVDALYKAGRSGMWMDLDSLRIEAGYQTQPALVWQLQELLAVGVVMTSDGDIQRNWENPFTEWKLTEQFEELWRKGGLGG